MPVFLCFMKCMLEWSLSAYSCSLFIFIALKYAVVSVCQSPYPLSLSLTFFLMNATVNMFVPDFGTCTYISIRYMTRKGIPDHRVYVQF